MTAPNLAWHKIQFFRDFAFGMGAAVIAFIVLSAIDGGNVTYIVPAIVLVLGAVIAYVRYRRRLARDIAQHDEESGAQTR
ncbi:hypothetical protein D9V34_07840 [Mycetocola lacteus]|uniref:DUF3188 domain-containing protein n=1 Tax=Mycetocola lacteus TaxID=76637 RepID=A0A3L7ARK6_9MICO|nr:hypothetical protein [Mycetocola lacteus]RLP83133.1 hypothetical protein D9V34_07840 [Mycetocola lacteus]